MDQDGLDRVIAEQQGAAVQHAVVEGAPSLDVKYYYWLDIITKPISPPAPC